LLISPLFDKIKDYLDSAKEEQQILFFVPYIKTSILSKLMRNITNQKIIITSWKPNDVLLGSSELELYPFCKDNGITLYINNRIHLKVYSLNLESAIIASGNISQNGLLPMGNFEIGEFIEKISHSDRLYLEKIKNDSILVNDDLYQQYKKWYDIQTKEQQREIILDEIITIPKKDQFLISALPMTENVQDLIDGYVKINSGSEPSDDLETASCIYHDLANYSIELGLTKDHFVQKLKIQFFSHPFIKKIDEFINPEAYFGRIKEWIQNNCTDVPIPSRRELTVNVKVLLEWFEKLGDGKYVIDIPGSHSQRIRKMM